jgi:heat-inducible transcriptional repressor
VAEGIQTERHREVLRAIIRDYIATAEPVGSRAVSRRYAFNLSPATIRNIMADLEETGYLTQPHTSAGRVPTDQAYRYFVDSLIARRPLSRAEASRIEDRVRPVAGEVEELLRETSRALSLLSHHMGVVLAPRLEQTTFRGVECVPLAGSRVLVVLVAESGLVQHRVIPLDEAVGQDELDRISRLLTDMVSGLTLPQARELLVARMREEKALYDRLLQQALTLAHKTFEAEAGAEAEVYIGGAANIMREPEFADVEKMKGIFAAFEEKSKLVKILDACLAAEAVTVIIGKEHQIREMRGFSLVTSPYRRGDRALGTLGVIGPTRMEYARVISLVDYTARLISRLLSEGN